MREAKGRLLSIEDQPDTVSGTLAALRRRGYIIESATTLVQARENLRGIKYDLLIVDVLMPEVEGGEQIAGGGVALLEQLKKGDFGPLNKSVPFVVATAQAAFVDSVGRFGRAGRVMSSERLRQDCIRVEAKAADILGLADFIDLRLSGGAGQ